MNLIYFVAIEIKLDTEKNHIHNKLYLKIKLYIRIDDHFCQFNTFSKKANRFGWNVLRSTMFQVFSRKIHQIPTEKMNFLKSFYFLFLKSSET
jgi:hypothetical protein